MQIRTVYTVQLVIIKLTPDTCLTSVGGFRYVIQ